jgi:hypothetical protein
MLSARLPLRSQPRSRVRLRLPPRSRQLIPRSRQLIPRSRQLIPRLRRNLSRSAM